MKRLVKAFSLSAALAAASAITSVQAGAVELDSMYTAFPSDSAGTSANVGGIIYEEVETVIDNSAEDQSAQEETVEYLSTYDYDRTLPYNAILPDLCGEVQTLEAALKQSDETVYVPMVNADGICESYDEFSAADPGSWRASHQGGICDFIYNDLEEVLESEIDTDAYDRIYFISDSMFASLGVLFAGESGELYFDISAYYTAQDEGYIFTGEQMLESVYQDYLYIISTDGEMGLPEGYDNSPEEPVEIIEEETEPILPDEAPPAALPSEDVPVENPPTGTGAALPAAVIAMALSAAAAAISRR